MKGLVASLTEDTKRIKAEAEQRTPETDRQISELGKHIGGLDNKFGSFTEGIVMPFHDEEDFAAKAY